MILFFTRSTMTKRSPAQTLAVDDEVDKREAQRGRWPLTTMSTKMKVQRMLAAFEDEVDE